jgi:hypothetical protein
MLFALFMDSTPDDANFEYIQMFSPMAHLAAGY